MTLSRHISRTTRSLPMSRSSLFTEKDDRHPSDGCRHHAGNKCGATATTICRVRLIVTRVGRSTTSTVSTDLLRCTVWQLRGPRPPSQLFPMLQLHEFVCHTSDISLTAIEINANKDSLTRIEKASTRLEQELGAGS